MDRPLDQQPLTNGWNQWEKLIIYRLDTLAKSVEELKEAAVSLTAGHADLKQDIGEIKLKSGMWGALSGAMATALGGLGIYLTSK
jgi:hypothetical protein